MATDPRRIPTFIPVPEGPYQEPGKPPTRDIEGHYKEPSARLSITQAIYKAGDRNRLLGAETDRLTVTMVNVGANTFYLGDSEQGATLSQGFVLLAGAGLTLDSRADLWGFSPAGTTIALIAEYRSI